MEHSERQNSAGQDKDLVVCPGCLAENVPSVDFCQSCGWPLSSTATIDPLRRAYSMGWAYRRSANGPIRLVVLVGMWLVILPTAVCLPFNFYLRPPDGLSFPACTGYAVLYAVLWSAGGDLLYRITRNYLRRRRVPVVWRDPTETAGERE